MEFSGLWIRPMRASCAKARNAYGASRDGMTSGDSSMPLAMKSGSYWNMPMARALFHETAPIRRPNDDVGASVTRFLAPNPRPPGRAALDRARSTPFLSPPIDAFDGADSARRERMCDAVA